MNYNFFNIIGNKIAEQLLGQNLFPIFVWKRRDKFVEKRESGVTLYSKPPKNNFTHTHKKPEIHRHLCTAAYR